MTTWFWMLSLSFQAPDYIVPAFPELYFCSFNQGYFSVPKRRKEFKGSNLYRQSIYCIGCMMPRVKVNQKRKRRIEKKMLKFSHWRPFCQTSIYCISGLITALWILHPLTWFGGYIKFIYLTIISRASAM